MEWMWEDEVKKSVAQQRQEEKIINFYTSLGYSRSLIQWCLNSSLLTRETLLIAIPNNKKRMIGLPLTRLACQGRKKKKYKQTLLNYAITTLMWGAAQEQIDELWNEQFRIYKELRCGDCKDGHHDDETWSAAE